MKLLPAHADHRLPMGRIVSVPLLSTMAGSAMALLPLLTAVPLLPPFGLLMLLGWRLLRPEMWAAWVAVPLGLFDDLLSGNPIGTAMTLWTAILLAFDLIDGLVLWRDHWADWLLAAMAIQLVAIGTWLLAGLAGGHGAFATIAPQIVGAILCYPVIVRIIAILDRWRLRR